VRVGVLGSEDECLVMMLEIRITRKNHQFWILYRK